MSQNTALDIVPQLFDDVPRKTVSLRLRPVQKRLQMLEQDSMQELLLGYPTLIGKLFVLRRGEHDLDDVAKLGPNFTSPANTFISGFLPTTPP